MRESSSAARFIIRDCDAVPGDPLGGKARAFAILRKADLPIPQWFVVTPDAFENDHLIPRAEFELKALVADLCNEGGSVAVRSSAAEEDAVQHSFAGQLETFLFVDPGEVSLRVMQVYCSAFGERVRVYRREHGIAGPPRPPSVLVQKMIRARVAGVAFSADPVSGRRGIAVIAATEGVAASLVSGQCDSDTYRVDREGKIVAREIASKRVDNSELTPDTQAAQAALTDSEACAVADLARRAERVFGRPQDIEWAIEGDKVYLLQSRPITSLAAMPDPDGAFAIWDNSNIVESYGGITTPLTFSFIQPVYAEVYRQFCRIMGVPEALIAANGPMFARMVGLIRGRVYYNLLNWYRMLALLPGYKLNRRFMEQMMGVKESLPDDAMPAQSVLSALDRTRDAVRLLRSTLGILRHHFTLERRMKLFYRRVESALGLTRPDLSNLRADELIAYYRDVERQLLTRWDTPLVNDFFAMIFYGLLRRLTSGWLNDPQGTLQNDLLCGEGGMISTEPAQLLKHLAESARDDHALVRAFCTASAEEVTRRLRGNIRCQELFARYVEKFGDRCTDELKLESPTLHEDPLPLFRAIGHLAARLRPGNAVPNDDDSQKQNKARHQAETHVREKLTGHPLRRAIFTWVLKNARDRVRDRENLRFERTRVFGRVRMIVSELGRRLYAADSLDDPADVFYLTIDEIFGFAEGAACCTDLKSMVRLRKEEFARFRSMEAPAERFCTRGMVNCANSFRDTSTAHFDSLERRRVAGAGVTSPGEDSADTRRGTGCCPGKVRGRVRVVKNPKDIPSESGCVLVAERTDPSWILIFPSAAGVLVERGSLLSHSAIVARELGIPTVVSVSGLMAWLKDGDIVEFDGATGVVTRLPDIDSLAAATSASTLEANVR